MTFKSDRPVSFRATIEFRDDRELALCSLTVYAIADNGLLTTCMHPTRRQSVSDDACAAAAKHLEKRLSNLSTSSDTATDDEDCDENNDQKVSVSYERIRTGFCLVIFFSFFFSLSPFE